MEIWNLCFSKCNTEKNKKQARLFNARIICESLDEKNNYIELSFRSLTFHIGEYKVYWQDIGMKRQVLGLCAVIRRQGQSKW